jgi:hypothetical protein
MTKDIAKLFSARALKHRSPVCRWLTEHYAEIVAQFRNQARPAWTALAETAADAGVRDKGEQLYSKDAVRMAWKQLERDMSRSGQHPSAVAPSNPPPVTTQQTAPPTPVRPAQTPQPAASPTRPRHTFRVATFKEDT